LSSFIFLALLAGVIGLIGMANIHAIKEADIRLYQNNTMAIGYLDDAAVDFQRTRATMLKAALDSKTAKEQNTGIFHAIRFRRD
jgi:methyl-accepting chemotaxis protein